MQARDRSAPVFKVTAAYRLPNWLAVAVKVEAAERGVRPHVVVEEILTARLGGPKRPRTRDGARASA